MRRDVIASARPVYRNGGGGRSNGAVAARCGILGIDGGVSFDRSVAVASLVTGFIVYLHIQIILGIEFEFGKGIGGDIGLQTSRFPLFC